MRINGYAGRRTNKIEVADAGRETKTSIYWCEALQPSEKRIIFSKEGVFFLFSPLWNAKLIPLGVLPANKKIFCLCDLRAYVVNHEASGSSTSQHQILQERLRVCSPRLLPYNDQFITLLQ